MKNPLDAAYELMSRGALDEAEAACRQVLRASKSRNAQAWIILGMVLRERGKLDESEAAYRRAISITPRDAYAHHNLGALLSARDRPEDALAALNRSRSLGLNAHELHVNRGRALMQLYQLDDAEKAYAQAVAIEPRDSTAQAMLAQLRYMRGDAGYARNLLEATQGNPTHAGLHLTLGELQRRTNDFAPAEATLLDLKGRVGTFPELSAALARLYLESGRLPEAQVEAVQALSAKPHETSFVDTAVSILLASGRPDEALAIIRLQRARQPDDQRWIAYEATAARMLDLPLYRELYDYSRFVRTYDIAPPAGWTSIQEFNEALAKALRARHLFETHPLDQSLRNGSQTARNLMTDADAAVKALLRAFEAPLADYAQSLGAMHDHPLSAHNRAAPALRGCWSVELRNDGYHLNHVHPQGWLSSAYYVQVPGNTSDAQAKSGWIKFGEPGIAVPSLAAEHFVEPRAGRLVLFPSYMWHGTHRVSGSETRLTVAFDAVAPRQAG
jgi:Tfp pilus assembly protein PilF